MGNYEPVEYAIGCEDYASEDLDSMYVEEGEVGTSGCKSTAAGTASTTPAGGAGTTTTTTTGTNTSTTCTSGPTGTSTERGTCSGVFDMRQLAAYVGEVVPACVRTHAILLPVHGIQEFPRLVAQVLVHLGPFAFVDSRLIGKLLRLCRAALSQARRILPLGPFSPPLGSSPLGPFSWILVFHRLYLRSSPGQIRSWTGDSGG